MGGASLMAMMMMQVVVVQDLECSDLWWHAASFVILCLPASTSMSMTMMTIFDLGLEHLATVLIIASVLGEQLCEL